MNTRTALRKSLLIEPAADALRRSETERELDEAWRDYCANFAGASPERRELFSIYTVRLVALRKAAMMGNILRV